MSIARDRIVEPDDDGIRFDRWFRRHYPELGHGPLEKLLRTGQIRLDGHRAKASTRIVAGQVVRLPPILDAALQPPTERRMPSGDELDLRDRILFRNEDLIVIDKPAGLPVQGGSGVTRHVDGALDSLATSSTDRPRLTHRLDRDTSGVLVLARSAGAASRVSAAFRRRETVKIYWAVVSGVPNPRAGRIDVPLAKSGPTGRERMHQDDEGRTAVTDYRVIDSAARTTAFVVLEPRTGRTHQLRAHMAAVGTPVLGDRKYGDRHQEPSGRRWRLHLHARALALPDPSAPGRWIRVAAPLPPHMGDTFVFFGFNASADPFDPDFRAEAPD